MGTLNQEQRKGGDIYLVVVLNVQLASFLLILLVTLVSF